MVAIKRAVAVTALLSSASAFPRYNPYEKRQDLPPTDERAQAVVETFRTAWEGYVVEGPFL